jgi:hypothetical protein
MNGRSPEPAIGVRPEKVLAWRTGPTHGALIKSWSAHCGTKRGNAVTVEVKRSGAKRWFVLFLISLMYLVTYLDRANISTVAPVIAKEFDIGKTDSGRGVC